MIKGRMSDAHKLLLTSLTSYYQKRPKYRKIVYEIIEGISPLSLRVIDWFMTHYARNHHVLYWIDDASDRLLEEYPEKGGTDLRKFHLYLEYRAALKSFTKMYMDPFRRHQRITFVLETDPLVSVETTVGQLNFFRFALSNHVIEYIQNHLAEVESHMALHQKQLKQHITPTTNRKEVSKPVNSVLRAPCHLRFD
jgi:hypothetical protein